MGETREAEPAIGAAADPMRERAARRKEARRAFSAQQPLGFAGARAQLALGGGRAGVRVPE